MYRVSLNKDIFEYLLSILNYKLKDEIKDVVKENDKFYFSITVDTKLDIMEFVEDKQLEIGFVNEDYLNEDGKKLQIIYDELYYQTN